jgi:uncharacterized protein YbjT (DUF2867 family)
VIDQPILVTGATGRQGGATARRLLAEGWPVRALVRDPHSPPATALARVGAELVVGDLDDRASLDRAALGAHGVFSVQPAFVAPVFAENEPRRGRNVADAAHSAGVGHLVYASVASADRATGIPHWEIKWQLEQYVRELGVPATVPRPVMFMELLADPTYGVGGTDPIIQTIRSDVTVQLIAVDDIGAFAALSFAEPERFLGRAIELAGAELTRHELLTALSRATGRDFGSVAGSTGPGPVANAPLGQPMRTTSSFCGWQADLPALRTLRPPLLDFDAWLSRQRRALLARHLGAVGAR